MRLSGSAPLAPTALLVRGLGWLALLLALSLTEAGAATRCNLMMYPRVPVRMENLQPVVSTEIDGADADLAAAAQAAARYRPALREHGPEALSAILL